MQTRYYFRVFVITARNLFCKRLWFDIPVKKRIVDKIRLIFICLHIYSQTKGPFVEMCLSSSDNGTSAPDLLNLKGQLICVCLKVECARRLLFNIHEVELFFSTDRTNGDVSKHSIKWFVYKGHESMGVVLLFRYYPLCQCIIEN